MISRKRFEKFLQEKNEKSFRIKQILTHYYKSSVRDFTDVFDIPKILRKDLTDFILDEEKKVPEEFEVATSRDGTEKVLFKTSDGKFFESVFIPHEKRNTICVSSQIGCPVKCAFCLTGTMGFFRNLTSAEILYQVFYWQKKYKFQNIVFMGQGEPFLNFDVVAESVETLSDNLAFGFGARHITVSTSGITSKILEFAHVLRGQANLAISLHAPNQILREKLVPFAKKFPLDDLMEICKEYVKLTKRKIFFEYVMLKNVNDTEKEAYECGKILSQNPLFHLNLINYNETELGFEKSTKNRIESFAKIVRSFGVQVTIRPSHGEESFSACGQLGNRKIKDLGQKSSEHF
ncbi:MAG: 23S rRNA (adenine(2503)-C(2))-methyltransferase RlmN [Patescibacteria group bacterium]